MKNRNFLLGKHLPWVVTYIILIFFAFVAIMPLFWMWQAAFQVYNPNRVDPFAFANGFTVDNIIKAWQIGRMSIYMKNSLLVAIPRVAVVLLISSMAGFAFGKLRWKGRDTIFKFILLGMMVPIQAMLIPIYYNMQQMHLINSLWAMILPYFGLSMPFACFMMRAFYRDLPEEIVESAKMDGCNKALTWIYIMAPLTKPAFVSLLIFEFMWSWNDYLLPMLMAYDDSARTMPLGLNYFQSAHMVNQTLIAAGVTICTVPIIIVFAIFQRSFVEGITGGAVKG